jgi:DNA-binding NarL/FixJ family response regulator
MLDVSELEAIEIDIFDKQILFHLSKGTKTKDIPQYVPISLSAIEKRKMNLKNVLGIYGETDLELVKVAKDRGLLF